MKKIMFCLACCYLFLFTAAGQDKSGFIEINKSYSKAVALQALIDSFAVRDLPGISVAVFTEAEGWWAGAAGYSNLEKKSLMQVTDLHYIQSVSKTYMATVILQLREEGRIQLDAPITKYLSGKLSSYIQHAEKITVRMLLSHTSGIAEYVSDPEYIRTVLLEPTTVTNMHTVLACLSDDSAQFKPGTGYTYTNTNYALLALIADAVTGDHAKYMADKIFKPLGLADTYYRNKRHYLKQVRLVASYWDLLNTGRPANISAMQKANVGSLVGDDGIISTPVDVVKFMRGLAANKLLHDSSYRQMQQWTKNSSGYEIYGLGLAHIRVGELDGVGHGGGGIGAGCVLLYVPEKKTFIFVATNVGVIWEGLPAEKANAMKDAVWQTVLN